MRERATNSPMRRGLEIIRESFGPRRRSASMNDIVFPEGDCIEERELSDICTLVEEEEEEQGEEERKAEAEGEGDGAVVKDNTVLVQGMPKPHAGFSSHRQRAGHGRYSRSRMASPTPFKARPSEDYGPIVSRVSSAPINWQPEMAWESDEGLGATSPLVDISQKEVLDLEGLWTLRKHKQRSLSSAESTEEAREEAWERRSQRILMDEMREMNEDRKARAIGRSVSDCGDRTWPRPPTGSKRHTRARSLTDEDLDELRGCIDLGFGFSNEENPKLCSTLPALELCYAIAKQYHDGPGRTSPVSTLDAGDILDWSGGGSSSQSSPLESWRIASPGDNPTQVKTRLRHWAQAVACTVRQAY